MFYAGGRDARYALSQGELRSGLSTPDCWPAVWEPPESQTYIVTAHGCEIDRGERGAGSLMPLQAAPVYPLSELGGDAGKVRGSQFYRMIWLPGPTMPRSPFSEEMYADLALSHPFTLEDLADAEWSASLGTLAVKALQAQLIRYYTRRDFLTTPPE